jgi:YidC/Oxa1 family membrane protein insertase
VFDLIATVLAWFYEIVPSYGLAIIFLTLAVMVVLTPLTLKGTRSMMAMQQLQPEMKKIQQKYKGDRQKLNEEMLKFYQENKINPLGGCLPLLIQMPVFLVLYRVIQGLTKTGSDGNFDPSYLDHSSQLYKDLSNTDQMLFLGIDLSESAQHAFSQSIGEAIPYLILIGLVALTGWYQNRQIQARRSSTPVSDIGAQQQAIMKYMWLILPVFSWAIPAGVVLYFLASNLYRVGQQAYIQKTAPIVIPGESKGSQKSEQSKSPKAAKAGQENAPSGSARGQATPKNGDRQPSGAGNGDGGQARPVQRPRRRKKKR